MIFIIFTEFNYWNLKPGNDIEILLRVLQCGVELQTYHLLLKYSRSWKTFASKGSWEDGFFFLFSSLNPSIFGFTELFFHFSRLSADRTDSPFSPWIPAELGLREGVELELSLLELRPSLRFNVGLRFMPAIIQEFREIYRYLCCVTS